MALVAGIPTTKGEFFFQLKRKENLIRTKTNRHQLTSDCIKPPNVAEFITVVIAKHTQASFSIFRVVASSAIFFVPAITSSFQAGSGDLVLLGLAMLVFIVVTLLYFLVSASDVREPLLFEPHTSFGKGNDASITLSYYMYAVTVYKKVVIVICRVIFGCFICR